MCVVPMLTFERLFAFLILGHDWRHLLWFEVTRRSTAEWLASPVEYRRSLGRRRRPVWAWDNDGAYGHGLLRRLRTTGIRDQPILPGHPWQHGHVERLSVPYGVSV